MSTGAQPPGAGVAPCQKCACCGNDAHSKGQAITEEQYYGVAPVTCTTTGQTVPVDANYVPIYHQMRTKCSELFSKPPCNTYYIASKQERDEILDVWNGQLGDQARLDIGATAKEKVNHRVPKNAGGCPTGKGNLTIHRTLSKECQEADERLTQRQTKRIEKLRIAAGVK